MSLLVAAIALLCLPALAQAREPIWLVGTSSGVAAARAVPGERLAPGIRVVRGNASTARRLRSLPGVRFVEPNRRFNAEQPLGAQRPALQASSGRSAARAHARAWAATVGDERARRCARLGARLLETSGPRGQRLEEPRRGPGERRRRRRQRLHRRRARRRHRRLGRRPEPTASGTARRWRASSPRAATTGSVSAAVAWNAPPDAGQGPSRRRLGHDRDDDRRAALRARRGRPRS